MIRVGGIGRCFRSLVHRVAFAGILCLPYWRSGTAYAQDATWRAPATSGRRAPTGAPVRRCRPAQRRSPTTVRPQRSPSRTRRRSTRSISPPQHRPIHSPSATPRPSRSMPSGTVTTLPPSTRPSASARGQRWRSGMARRPRSARSRAAARSILGPTDPGTLLAIVGSSSTTFSGSFSGAGSLELDNIGTSLTLTGASNGGNIGTIGGDLTLCDCFAGGLTISGGSLTVGGSGLSAVSRSGRHALGDQRRHAADRVIGDARRSPGREPTCSSPAPAPA